MRRRKWLLIIVSFLFIINIGFFSAVKLGKLDRLLQHHISAFISESINAETSIEKIAFNDTQLNISNIKILSKDKLFDVNIEQVYISYNLLKMIVSGFKMNSFVNEIQIFNPQINYFIRSKKNKNNKKFVLPKLPELSQYFKKMQISDGFITIKYESNKFNIEEQISNIDFKIYHIAKKSIAELSSTINNSELSGTISIEDGEIINLTSNIKNYFPQNFSIRNVNRLDFSLDCSLDYDNKNGFLCKTKIKDIETQIKNIPIKADSILIEGNFEKLQILTNNLIIDQQIAKLTGNITNPFSKNNVLDLEATGIFNIQDYIKEVQGIIDVNTNIKGTFSEPIAEAYFESKFVSYAKQNFSNIKINAEYKNKYVDIIKIGGIWNNNYAEGNGFYDIGKELKLFAHNPEFIWDDGYNKAIGEVDGCFQVIGTKLFAEVNISNAKYENDFFMMDNLNAKASMKEKDVFFSMISLDDDFEIDLKGNISELTSQNKIILKRFNPNKYLKKTLIDNMPIFSGKINTIANFNNIILTSSLRIFDKKYGIFDGNFYTDFVLDFLHNRSLFHFRTNNGKFNFEPFSINMMLNGDLDKISTSFCKINDDIDLDLWVSRQPKFEFGSSIKGKNLNIQNYLKYVMEYSEVKKLEGKLDFDLHYNQKNLNKFQGSIKLHKGKYSFFKNINANFKLNGTTENINIKQGNVFIDKHKFLEIDGKIINNENFDFNTNINILETDINEFSNDSNFRGKIKGKLKYNYRNNENFSVSLKGGEMAIDGIEMDSLSMDILQLENKIIVNDISINKRKLFSLSASGAVGYNILTNKITPDTSTISLKFDGDLLKILSQKIDVFDKAKSKTKIDVSLQIQEEGLSIKRGIFNLKKGTIRIKTQQEKLDNISINAVINDNIFNLKKCKMRLGEGYLYIKNEIDNSNKSLKLGKLNLGIFKLWTNAKGLTCHIPQYMPQKEVVKIYVSGRYSDFLEINGPFDDINIIGNLRCVNGNVVYPPNTNNILNLINTSMKALNIEEDSYQNILPFTLDLKIIFGENIHYVTEPANIIVKPESYLFLKYINGEWKVPDAFFSSEKGSFDFVGSIFNVDYIQLAINDHQGVSFLSNLYRKVADGTLVTLKISPKKSNSRLNNNKTSFQLKLESDNPDDTSAEKILAKLRYNRSIDQLSREQRQSLIQDEALDLLGKSLENYLVDPWISPIENRIRKFFKLDFFYIKPGFIENIVSEYGVSSEANDTYIFDQESQILRSESNIIQNGTDLLFDNLSIHVGKYFYKNLFIDYQSFLHKPNYVNSKKFSVTHSISLKHSLPAKFKMSYSLILDPEKKEEFEVKIEKSFRFW